MEGEQDSIYTDKCMPFLSFIQKNGIKSEAGTASSSVPLFCITPHISEREIKNNQFLFSVQNKTNTWPSSGKVQLKNVYLKYHEEGRHILKNINLNIESGVKVGIVGRTGAGKSSLIAALFRLAEIEGSIEIDGINTKNIPLEVFISLFWIFVMNEYETITF